LRFLIPLQRSLAALALSGAASLRTIPLRRFHPGVGPRVLFKATCRPDDFLRRPCGFPLERIPCDEARVADVLGPEAFQSNPSLARRVSPMGSDASVSAGRRSVAPTATSSIARAGEIGETDLAGSVSCKVCATPRQPAHRPPAIHLMSSRSRATHTTRAPSLRLRRPQRVIRHDRAFFAWRSATRLEHCTAWPDDAGLPFLHSSSSDGAPGVLPRPSQV